jgi:hypothetical protein
MFQLLHGVAEERRHHRDFRLRADERHNVAELQARRGIRNDFHAVTDESRDDHAVFLPDGERGERPAQHFCVCDDGPFAKNRAACAAQVRCRDAPGQQPCLFECVLAPDCKQYVSNLQVLILIGHGYDAVPADAGNGKSLVAGEGGCETLPFHRGVHDLEIKNADLRFLCCSGFAGGARGKPFECQHRDDDAGDAEGVGEGVT